MQGFFLCALHAIYAFHFSGKLSFCIFGTGFLEILNWVLPKLQNFNTNLAIFWEILWKKLSFGRFWTEFLAENWVFWKFWELGFPKFRTGFFGFAQKNSLYFQGRFIRVIQWFFHGMVKVISLTPTEILHRHPLAIEAQYLGNTLRRASGA